MLCSLECIMKNEADEEDPNMTACPTDFEEVTNPDDRRIELPTACPFKYQSRPVKPTVVSIEGKSPWESFKKSKGAGSAREP